jgi:2'-5' RNA ligase
MNRGDSGKGETKTTRAFVALDLDEASIHVVERAAAKLRKSAPSNASLRWTPSPQIHVTVKFLGNVTDATLDNIGDAVRALGDKLGALHVRVARIGGLPSLARATVLVAALEDRTGGLASLARRFEEHAVGIGVPREDRTYRPHVTLARVRAPSDLRTWVEGVALPPADLKLVGLALYRSDPGPSGANYTPLAHVPLT